MIPLLVLRPEPGAAATAARARALGLEAIAAPLFTIAPLAWAPPPAADFDAVMLTSANAVRHAGPALALYRGLPVFAVGEATAAAARAAGFARVHAAEGDAADLLALLAATGIARALHLCGTERREAAHPAVRIERIAVYRAVPVAEVPAEMSGRTGYGPSPADLGAAEPTDAIALLHSPRAAALFASLLDDAMRARVGIAAISPAAAEAAGPGWRTIAIAAAPTDAALLAVAARLCEDGG